MKFQISNPKIQTNSKIQTSIAAFDSARHEAQRTFGIWSLGFVWILGFGIWNFGHAAETTTTNKPFVPSTKYATTRVAGWTVRVNRELLTTQSALGSNALALLAMKLREITNTVPPRAAEALKRVPIWLGVNDGHAPCAEYHPSKDWLVKNGYNPEKAKGVEIGNARKFIAWTPKQPMMILHELAHAYHDQVLSFDDTRIRAAFERAKSARRYESVERNNGRSERAYALTDHKEYFAEATEAFFGTNDFYPFTREELRKHDREIHEVLAEVWAR